MLEHSFVITFSFEKNSHAEQMCFKKVQPLFACLQRENWTRSICTDSVVTHKVNSEEPSGHIIF